MLRPAIASLAALALIQGPSLAQDPAPTPEATPEAVPGAAPEAASPRRDVSIIYNGYLLGLRVMKATVTATVEDGGYQSDAVFRSAGIAGLFKDARIEAGVGGVLDEERLAPRRYEHRNLASSKNRVIAIDFVPDDVVSTVTPPFGSMGQPPATREERLGSFDPITAFLAIALEGGDSPCDRTVPVFDGKQRFNLRFAPAEYEEINSRAYDGPAWHCYMYYQPVAGFDPEDLADPEDYARPMHMWLADLGDGQWAPVRIRARVSGVGVRVEASRARVVSEDPPNRAETDGATPDRG